MVKGKIFTTFLFLCILHFISTRVESCDPPPQSESVDPRFPPTPLHAHMQRHDRSLTETHYVTVIPSEARLLIESGPIEFGGHGHGQERMDDDDDDDVDTFELVALVAVNCNGLTSKLEYVLVIVVRTLQHSLE